MQGYILRVQKTNNEDLLVFILTNDKFVKCYRFYGARHPVITQGYKLDFELEISSGGNFLPHLRNTLHLGFSWLFNRDRLLIWQQFMNVLYEHLKDSSELDSFYFDMLETCAQKFAKQNPQRVVIEAYISLLAFEGRLHEDMVCFLCDKKIKNEVCLERGFLPAHPHCISKFKFEVNEIARLFQTHSTVNLNDEKVKELYYIILEGL